MRAGRVMVAIAALVFASAAASDAADSKTTQRVPSAVCVEGEGREGGTTHRLANDVVRLGITVGDAAMGGMT